MLQFNAEPFVSCYRTLGIVAGAMLAERARDGGGIAMPAHAVDALKVEIEGLCLQLQQLELNLTLDSARKALQVISIGEVHPQGIFWPFRGSAEQLESHFHQMGERFKLELGNRMMLSLSPLEANFYEGRENPFGKLTATFPSLTYEVEQALKCFALGLSTACAFHSIRCLEAGLRAIARCLGIPDPTTGAGRNWSSVLRNVKLAIDAKWQAKDKMSGDGKLFERFYAVLEALRNPYRNETMHLDAKYTETEAKQIMEIIGAFMQDVAARMDENGQPTA